jgi:hypothetical protein
MPTVVKTAGWLLQSLHAGSSVHSVGDGVEVPGNPWFRYHHCDAWSLAAGLHEVYEGSPVLPPVPDWSLWNGTARVYEVLNALDDYPTWAPTSGTSEVAGYAIRPAAPLSGPMEVFTCIVADWMLPFVSGRAVLDEASLLKHLHPIWPGLEHVVTQSPISVNAPVNIGGSCNGILVDLNVVPNRLTTYDWGEITQTPRVGYVAFYNDAGYVEDLQPVTFAKEIVCPRLCRLASGLYVRPATGVELTVTPWTYYVP